MRLLCDSSGVLLKLTITLHIMLHYKMCNYLQFGMWQIPDLQAGSCAQPSAKFSQVCCYFCWVCACWSCYSYLIFQIMHVCFHAFQIRQMLCCLSQNQVPDLFLISVVLCCPWQVAVCFWGLHIVNVSFCRCFEGPDWNVFATYQPWRFGTNFFLKSVT